MNLCDERHCPLPRRHGAGLDSAHGDGPDRARDVRAGRPDDGLRAEAGKLQGLRKSYLTGLAVSLETMWDLAMEVLGKGDPVPYARSVEASTAKPPEPSRP